MLASIDRPTKRPARALYVWIDIRHQFPERPKLRGESLIMLAPKNVVFGLARPWVIVRLRARGIPQMPVEPNGAAQLDRSKGNAAKQLLEFALPRIGKNDVGDPG